MAFLMGNPDMIRAFIEYDRGRNIRYQPQFLIGVSYHDLSIVYARYTKILSRIQGPYIGLVLNSLKGLNNQGVTATLIHSAGLMVGAGILPMLLTTTFRGLEFRVQG